MLSWFGSLRKKKVDRDVAARQFIDHCSLQGQLLEPKIATAISPFCDGRGGRPALNDILSKPLIIFSDGSFNKGQRTYFGAHCYAVALTVGLNAMYEHANPPSQARVIDHIVATEIAAEEVGPENMGHAPNPRTKSGGHVLYAPGTLTGGVDSRQLEILNRFRLLRSQLETLAVFCLSLGILPIGDGVGVAIYEEMEGGDDDEKFYTVNEYRRPEPGEFDEWSRDLRVFEPDTVLEPMPTEIYDALLAAIASIDAFWPAYSDSVEISW